MQGSALYTRLRRAHPTLPEASIEVIHNLLAVGGDIADASIADSIVLYVKKYIRTNMGAGAGDLLLRLDAQVGDVGKVRLCDLLMIVFSIGHDIDVNCHSGNPFILQCLALRHLTNGQGELP